MENGTQDDLPFLDEVINVYEAIENCLNQLVKNDFHLLQLDLNERTISGQLARYLQEVFREWHVDCEYNRNHDDAKRLELYPRKSSSVRQFNNTFGRTVFPDIIIHKRGGSENFVVIEVKKTTSCESEEFDIRKLKAFKNQLGYEYAVFVNLGAGRSVGYHEIKFVNLMDEVVCYKITEM